MSKLFLINGTNGKSKWINENFEAHNTIVLLSDQVSPSILKHGFNYMSFNNLKELFTDSFLWTLKYSYECESLEYIVIYQNETENQDVLHFLSEVAKQVNKSIYLTMITNAIVITQYEGE